MGFVDGRSPPAWGGGRDSPRRARYFAFASPKESTQRKGDPKSGSLRLRSGQPALLDYGGGPHNSPAAQTSAARPSASICAARPSHTGQAGMGAGTEHKDKTKKQGHAMACPCRVRYWSSVFLFPHPLVNAPRSAGSGGSGLALFERSEFSQTPPGPSTAGCPGAQRRGRRHQGRLSFAYFWCSRNFASQSERPPRVERAFGKQRNPASLVSLKVSCRRATPGLRPQQKTKKLTSASGPAHPARPAALPGWWPAGPRTVWPAP